MFFGIKINAFPAKSLFWQAKKYGQHPNLVVINKQFRLIFKNNYNFASYKNGYGAYVIEGWVEYVFYPPSFVRPNL